MLEEVNPRKPGHLEMRSVASAMWRLMSLQARILEWVAVLSSRGPS